MQINRVTLCGYTRKVANSAVLCQGCRMTRLFLATIRRYQDAQQQWQESKQWHQCVAYGPAAYYVAQIPAGAHVLLEGELVHHHYERTVKTDKGPVKVPWPVTEVVITSLSLLHPPNKPDAT